MTPEERLTVWITVYRRDSRSTEDTEDMEECHDRIFSKAFCKRI